MAFSINDMMSRGGFTGRGGPGMPELSQAPPPQTQRPQPPAGPGGQFDGALQKFRQWRQGRGLPGRPKPGGVVPPFGTPPAGPRRPPGGGVPPGGVVPPGPNGGFMPPGGVQNRPPMAGPEQRMGIPGGEVAQPVGPQPMMRQQQRPTFGSMGGSMGGGYDF